MRKFIGSKLFTGGIAGQKSSTCCPVQDEYMYMYMFISNKSILEVNILVQQKELSVPQTKLIRLASVSLKVFEASNNISSQIIFHETHQVSCCYSPVIIVNGKPAVFAFLMICSICSKQKSLVNIHF